MRPHGQFTWIDVSTPDTAAAARFYQSLFGWKGDDQDDGQGNYVYTMFSLDGKSVAGMGAQPPELQAAGVPPMWNSYVTVANLEETLEKVKAAGGAVVMEPMDVFDAGRMAFISDPEGATVALWQAGRHEGAEVFNAPGALAWNELATRDPETAKAFYGAAFGWSFEKLESGGPDDYWLITIDGKVDGDIDADDNYNGGLMPMSAEWPDSVPAHWAVYFLVTDTDETVARTKELGGTEVIEAFDSPAGRIGVLTDPQGAGFCVISPPSEGAPS